MKVVFIDIDGTLGIKNEESFLYNMNVIKKIREKGHKVFINTGRTFAFFPDELDIVNDFDGAVLGNGSHIIINGKTVFSQFMDKNFLLKSYKFCLKNNLIMTYQGDENMLYYLNKRVDRSNWFEINSEEVFEEYINKFDYRKITYSGVIKDISEFENLSDSIKVEPMGIYDGKPAESGEIIIKEAGKDKGIEKVIEILDVKKEDTIAIGDSMNDYHMIKYAGIGVAVANAEEKIKDIADMITDDCDKGGVGKALEKIFEGELV